jgi:hypothetical protein
MANGYPFAPAKKVQIANAAGFLAQKILIHHERDHKDRAKDLLYIHDTVELFAEPRTACASPIIAGGDVGRAGLKVVDEVRDFLG